MYMYTKLREALTGKKNDSKGWSPNNIKAIVITRDFILISKHISAITLVRLNPEESYRDIQKNGTNGALHNLLSSKQMSCLEEIYVDSVFANYLGIMDLQSFVNGLMSSERARLRYYGYIQNAFPDEVYNCYYQAKINALDDYTYALDQNRKSTIQYLSTNNTEWYKKYSLQPASYPMDAEKGSLHAWLKRVEKNMTKKREEELYRLQEGGISQAISTLFSQDMAYVEDMLLYGYLKTYLSSHKDTVDKSIYSVMKECSSKFNRYITVNSSILSQYVGNETLNSSKGLRVITVYSRKAHYFTDKGSIISVSNNVQLDLETLIDSAKRYNGLMGFPDLLLNILLEIVDRYSVKNTGPYSVLCFLLCKTPEALKDVRGYLVNKRNDSDCEDYFFKLLLGIAGYTREAFLKIVSDNVKDRGDV